MTLPCPGPQRGFLSYQLQSHRLLHQGSDVLLLTCHLHPVTDTGSLASEKRPRPAPGPLPRQGGHRDPRQLPGLSWSYSTGLAFPSSSRRHRCLRAAGIPAPPCLGSGLCWGLTYGAVRLLVSLAFWSCCCFSSTSSFRAWRRKGSGQEPALCLLAGSSPENALLSILSLPPSVPCGFLPFRGQPLPAPQTSSYTVRQSGPVTWMQGGKEHSLPIPKSRQGQSRAASPAAP